MFFAYALRQANQTFSVAYKRTLLNSGNQFQAVAAGRETQKLNIFKHYISEK